MSKSMGSGARRLGFCGLSLRSPFKRGQTPPQLLWVPHSIGGDPHLLRLSNMGLFNWAIHRDEGFSRFDPGTPLPSVCLSLS